MNTTTLAVFFIILGGSCSPTSPAWPVTPQPPSTTCRSRRGIKIATVLAEIFRAAFGQFGWFLFIIILIFRAVRQPVLVYDGIAACSRTS